MIHEKINKSTGEVLSQENHIILTPSAELLKLRERRRKKASAVAALPQTSDGLGIIGPRKIQNDSFIDDWQQEDEFIFDNPFIEQQPVKPKKCNHKLKKHKKKKTKKYRSKDLKKKSNPKRVEKLDDLKENCIGESEPHIASITSELFSLQEHVCVYEDKVYLYHADKGCFIHKDESQTKISLMKMFKKDERLCVWASDINNAYKTLLINPSIQKDISPRVNIPLVNYENGVLNVETMELLKHSPQFGFTSCIAASFNEEANENVFRQFLDDITMGEKDSKKLLQEVMGYLLSTYVYAKKAFIFYGVPHSGKSVLFNLTERLVGSENVCHVDLQKLSEPCYAARLNKSKLNIAPDLPQTPIKDIGTFKSLVSSLDKIETKELYKNPKSQPCYCKMLFGANQFVPLNKLDANNAEAFFERLIIIPFLYAKPVEERDPNLPEKLWAERDYIFTWAMKGLNRLIKNNFIFSSSKESEQVLEQYKTQYCPEQIFFSNYLVLDENKTISRDKVQKKYEKFADERGVKVGCYDIKDFISRNYPQVKQSRKRINGSKNPLAVYEGLAFAD